MKTTWISFWTVRRSNTFWFVSASNLSWQMKTPTSKMWKSLLAEFDVQEEPQEFIPRAIVLQLDPWNLTSRMVAMDTLFNKEYFNENFRYLLLNNLKLRSRNYRGSQSTYLQRRKYSWTRYLWTIKVAQRHIYLLSHFPQNACPHQQIQRLPGMRQSWWWDLAQWLEAWRRISIRWWGNWRDFNYSCNLFTKCFQ